MISKLKSQEIIPKLLQLDLITIKIKDWVSYIFIPFIYIQLKFIRIGKLANISKIIEQMAVQKRVEAE